MQELYYNGKLILGVDHGYGNMKTAHRIFAASVEKEDNPLPKISEDVLDALEDLF